MEALEEINSYSRPEGLNTIPHDEGTYKITRTTLKKRGRLAQQYTIFTVPDRKAGEAPVVATKNILIRQELVQVFSEIILI